LTYSLNIAIYGKTSFDKNFGFTNWLVFLFWFMSVKFNYSSWGQSRKIFAPKVLECKNLIGLAIVVFWTLLGTQNTIKILY
jgi:hypothetical protein